MANKTKAKPKLDSLSRAELGAASITEDVLCMLDQSEDKVRKFYGLTVDLLQAAERVGKFYIFRPEAEDVVKKTYLEDDAAEEYAEGREGYARAQNEYMSAISSFNRDLFKYQLYSLVNGKSPVEQILKIIRTCCKFHTACESGNQ